MLSELPWGQRVAAGWLLVFLALGLFAPWLGVGLGLDPNALDRGCLRGCGPSAAHWFGTDGLGRDVAAQLVFGARTAIVGGFGAALAIGVLGFGLGAGAAWHGRGNRVLSGWVLATAALLVGVGVYVVRFATQPVLATLLLILVGGAVLIGVARRTRDARTGMGADRLVWVLVETLSSVPTLLLLLALAALAIRPGLWQFILLYVGLSIPRMAALTLQEVRDQLTRPYVQAAHHAGQSSGRLLWRHVLPNALPPLLVEVLLSVAGFVLLEGTFSFLGLGLPETEPSWGRLLAATRSVRGAWWLWVFPGVALVGTVLALQTLGRKDRCAVG